MRTLALCLLLSGCAGGALGLPEPDAPCCLERDGQLVCRDATCPELAQAKECTTLANAQPTYCQVPLTNDCQAVYLERTVSSTGAPFQTVYCF